MNRSSPCVAIVLAAAAVAAQDKPDFSGNWILAGPTESGSNTAQTMTVRETFTRASIRGTPVEPTLITIAVDRQFASGERSDLYTVGVVGGTTAGVVGDVGGAGAGDQPSHTRFSTTWDGDRLVIEASAWAADAGSHSDHKEVWWLDAEERLLITVTDQEGADRKTTSLVYRVRP